jgi:hypothetical protein
MASLNSPARQIRVDQDINGNGQNMNRTNQFWISALAKHHTFGFRKQLNLHFHTHLPVSSPLPSPCPPPLVYSISYSIRLCHCHPHRVPKTFVGYPHPQTGIESFPSHCSGSSFRIGTKTTCRYYAKGVKYMCINHNVISIDDGCIVHEEMGMSSISTFTFTSSQLI